MRLKMRYINVFKFSKIKFENLYTFAETHKLCRCIGTKTGLFIKLFETEITLNTFVCIHIRIADTWLKLWRVGFKA